MMTEAMEAAFRNEKDWRIDPDVMSHFPEISPGVMPLGTRVLCQIVSAREVSAGGIILTKDTKDTEQWNTQVARVIALGPLAFRNRETAALWPEGMWAGPGDFVIIPRWGGQRRTVSKAGSTSDEEKIHFATINDLEIIERVYANPLKLETYIL